MSYNLLSKTNLEYALDFFRRHIKQDPMRYGEHQAIYIAIACIQKRLDEDAKNGTSVDTHRGYWKYDFSKTSRGVSSVCSVCTGYVDDIVHYPVCPHCGATMDKNPDTSDM